MNDQTQDVNSEPLTRNLCSKRRFRGASSWTISLTCLLVLAGCDSGPKETKTTTYDEALVKVRQRMPAESYFSNEFLRLAQSSPPAPPAKPDRLRIAMPWILNDEEAVWYVAVEKGYFREMGIDAELVPGGPGKDPLALLIGGVVDVAVAPGGAFVQKLVASPTGAKVIAVCTLLKDSPYCWIGLDHSVPNSQPSTKRLKPEEIVGKSVGLQEDGEVYAKYLIHKYSLPAEKIKIVRVGFSTDPLVTGVVDYYAGWIQNQPRFLERQGIKNWTILRFSDWGWNEHNDVSVVTKAFADKNLGLVIRYVAALSKAIQFYLNNPDETADITLKYSKDANLSKEMVLRRFQLERDLMVGHDERPPLWMSADVWDHAAALLTQFGVIDPPGK